MMFYVSLLSKMRGLALTLLLAMLVQSLLFLILLQDRNLELERDTNALTPAVQLQLQQLMVLMDEGQRQTFQQLINMPHAHIEFYSAPAPHKSVTALERFLGITVPSVEIQIGPEAYVGINWDPALRETYAFIAQISLLVLSFFVVVALISMRAQAALNPVYKFVEAAKRLSDNLHAPPMVIEGPQEIQQAVVAINRMQRALQEQVADRACLIAGISHDLRAYITRLILRVELMHDEVQREKALEDLAAMTNVVNQSLAFGKSAHLTEVLEEVDLAELLTGALAAYPQGNEAQTITIAPLPSLKVRVEPTSFSRVMQNLTENALRYGDRAYISVVIVRRSVRIYVDDEGPGIPEDKRQEVLKPFVRFEESGNKDTRGTGLGLALATTLLAGQNGQLSLDDVPGGGLRAIITLPLEI